MNPDDANTSCSAAGNLLRHNAGKQENCRTCHGGRTPCSVGMPIPQCLAASVLIRVHPWWMVDGGERHCREQAMKPSGFPHCSATPVLPASTMVSEVGAWAFLAAMSGNG